MKPNGDTPFPAPNPGDATQPDEQMDWDSVAGKLLKEYLIIHNRAVAEIKNRVEDPLQQVEALSKLSQALDRTFRSLQKVNAEHSPLAVATEVLRRQSDFVRERFPKHLPALLEILTPFGRELAKNFSK